MPEGLWWRGTQHSRWTLGAFRCQPHQGLSVPPGFQVRVPISWELLALPSILFTSPLLLPHQHGSLLTPGAYLLQPPRPPSVVQTSPKTMHPWTPSASLQRGFWGSGLRDERRSCLALCVCPGAFINIFNSSFAKGLLSTTGCHCARCWGYSGERDKQDPCPQGASSVGGEMRMIYNHSVGLDNGANTPFLSLWPSCTACIRTRSEI